MINEWSMSSNNSNGLFEYHWIYQPSQLRLYAITHYNTTNESCLIALIITIRLFVVVSSIKHDACPEYDESAPS